jgi:hypothetical protein
MEGYFRDLFSWEIFSKDFPGTEYKLPGLQGFNPAEAEDVAITSRHTFRLRIPIRRWQSGCEKWGWS